MKRVTVTPDRIEALAFATGAEIELDPTTHRMHLRYEGVHYVSTPLPVLVKTAVDW